MNLHTTQKGSVLIVSMLILLVMTLIGVTAMGTSALEEKMAGNGRDQNQAFQAAETTLRDAEDVINGMVATAGFNNTNGLYAIGAAPDIMLAGTWTTVNSRAYVGTLPGVTSQPRYIIELQPALPGNNNGAEIGSSYGGSTPPPLSVFRITTRATGGSDNAVIILQSYYGRFLL